MHRKFDTLIYKIGFPLLALGSILLGSFPITELGGFFMALGYRFIDLLIWSLVVYLTVQKRVPLMWLAGWSTTCLYVGITLGYFLIDLTAHFLGTDALELAMSFLAFALMLVALLITSAQNDSRAWGSLRPSSDTIMRPYLQEALNHVVVYADLTKRQGEILEFLRQGKTKKEIARELVLSQETVKVHIRNVYQKLDVHSQQELRTLIEQEELKLST